MDNKYGWRRFHRGWVAGLVLLAGCLMLPAAGEPVVLKLPATDFHYKETKGYVEEQPVAEYRHPSAEAYPLVSL